MSEEPHVDFTYPDDELTEEVNHYREAASHYLRVMNIWADYVARAENQRVALWATVYTLGLAICEGVSITDRAQMLGVSPQALSKAIREFQDELNLTNQAYTYDKTPNN